MSAPRPQAVVRWHWRSLSVATVGERTRLLTIGDAGQASLLTLAWSRWRLIASSPRFKQRRR